MGDVNDLRDSAVITSVAGGADPTAPVAPTDTIARLRPQADEVVCLATPRLFAAIGAFYEDFRQLSDEEVVDLLRRATRAGREPLATGSR